MWGNQSAKINIITRLLTGMYTDEFLVLSFDIEENRRARLFRRISVV